MRCAAALYRLQGSQHDEHMMRILEAKAGRTVPEAHRLCAAHETCRVSQPARMNMIAQHLLLNRPCSKPSTLSTWFSKPDTMSDSPNDSTSLRLHMPTRFSLSKTSPVFTQ